MADELFKSKIIAGKPGSGNLFAKKLVPENKRSSALGWIPNDMARRNYFNAELLQKTSDRNSQDRRLFPSAKTKIFWPWAIRPYYCAARTRGSRFISMGSEKPQKHDLFPICSRPFARISEGKNDPIYMPKVTVPKAHKPSCAISSIIPHRATLSSTGSAVPVWPASRRRCAAISLPFGNWDTELTKRPAISLISLLKIQANRFPNSARARQFWTTFPRPRPLSLTTIIRRSMWRNLSGSQPYSWRSRAECGWMYENQHVMPMASFLDSNGKPLS